MSNTFGNGFDWRGTKIEKGQTVLYGYSVGQSIALAEAVVEETPDPAKNRVKLRLTRRAFGSSSKPVVTVMCDRVTVVTQLPPTTLTTVGDQLAESELKDKIQKSNLASHSLLPEPKPPRFNEVKYRGTDQRSRHYILPKTPFEIDTEQYNRDWSAWHAAPCSVCGQGGGTWKLSQNPCPGYRVNP